MAFVNTDFGHMPLATSSSATKLRIISRWWSGFSSRSKAISNSLAVWASFRFSARSTAIHNSCRSVAQLGAPSGA